MTLEEERRKLEEQRRSLERERREFTRWAEIEDRRLKRQQQLFEMKFKILEEELQKLATEKAHVERQKEFYSRVAEHETNGRVSSLTEKGNGIVKGELFFSGVGSKQSLKKRYKDLIKIYHPDNMDGDTDTIQEINSEYNKLCALYEI